MQTETMTEYEVLAGLFEYPSADYAERLSTCLQEMAPVSPQTAIVLDKFRNAIEGQSTEELQELFTRSFDLNPTCTLEIGWHLFGEDYQRGEFLVSMRQQLRAKGVQESLELPDHLTHALKVMARMDSGEASDFARRYLLPALEKMRAAWRQDGAAFGKLLESVFILLSGRYPQWHKAAIDNPKLRVLR
jgi:nitrate reductase delta subunit